MDDECRTVHDSAVPSPHQSPHSGNLSRLARRNGEWAISQRRNGRWYTLPLGKIDREKAEEWLRRFRGEASKGSRRDPRVDAEPLASILRTRWRGARDRAKKFGVPFDLLAGDVIRIWQRARGKCEISGIPFSTDEPRGPWTPSLDRRDPKMGYTPDNCRMVCLAANVAMGRWGEEVLYTLAAAMRRRGRKQSS